LTSPPFRPIYNTVSENAFRSADRGPRLVVEASCVKEHAVKIQLKVNGTPHEDDVKPRLLLVHYLREVAGAHWTYRRSLRLRRPQEVDQTNQTR